MAAPCQAPAAVGLDPALLYPSLSARTRSLGSLSGRSGPRAARPLDAGSLPSRLLPNGRNAFSAGLLVAGLAAAIRRRPAAAPRRGQQRLARCAAADPKGVGPGPDAPAASGATPGADVPAGGATVGSKPPTPSPAEARAELMNAGEDYKNLSDGQRSAVSNFFFPDSEELDMDKSMPLDDHIREFREGVLRTAVAGVICVSVCLTFYKELTTALEAPAQANGAIVKFVQLGPGEFFFVSLKAAVAVGLLLAFPYALFEAALYFTPALTRSERNTVGPTVLASAVLFYGGVVFSQNVLAPAALGFFISYSQDVIESQFSIDQYFEFILSMGFATGLAFQVPVLQVALGLLNIIRSEQLFSAWRYVVVGSAVVGAILTPSTDPVTQLLLSGALCTLYFAGAGALVAIGR
eukprot:CAMPEP_0117499388 /NCGR_PEP_ID=MMETSP0784-20121206/22220_1 /TAXON_ID=39447 /ORGANISM="" /LENGTH=407 /DNA_ID=CAMNT_0005294535 /DNA_START=37 /DNA_END=1260 /DNA_ORIENTATION=+